tara:strand:+ start:146 stop:391 length:246 start_codon:yes stop_codon:yes gene_type:complete
MNTQKELYGMTTASIKREYREAQKIYGDYMNLYIMAILSDAQHLLTIQSVEADEKANQFINKAKYLLSNGAREYLDRAKDE